MSDKAQQQFERWRFVLDHIESKKELTRIEEYALIGVRERSGTSVIYLNGKLIKESCENREQIQQWWSKSKELHDWACRLCGIYGVRG